MFMCECDPLPRQFSPVHPCMQCTPRRQAELLSDDERAPPHPPNPLQPAAHPLRGSGGEVGEDEGEGPHKQPRQLVDDADLLKDHLCSNAGEGAEPRAATLSPILLRPPKHSRPAVCSALLAGTPGILPGPRAAAPQQAPHAPTTSETTNPNHTNHARAWVVEGGEEGDVAVADAHRVLDKQVGEAVGKPPAAQRAQHAGQPPRLAGGTVPRRPSPRSKTAS